MVHDEIADEDAPSECIVYATEHPVTDLHNVIGLKHRHVAVMVEIHVIQTQAVMVAIHVTQTQAVMVAIHVTQTQAVNDSNTCHSNTCDYYLNSD